MSVFNYKMAMHIARPQGEFMVTSHHHNVWMYSLNIMSLYLPLPSFDPVASFALYAETFAAVYGTAVPVVPQVQVGAIFYT